jgi:hypothetical protein
MTYLVSYTNARNVSCAYSLGRIDVSRKLPALVNC